MYSTQQFQNKLPVIGNGNSYARMPEEPGYIEQPSSEEYSKGAVPLETLPVQWWNWINNQYTSRINNAYNNTDGVFTNLFNELNNILLDKGITPSSSVNNQLVTALNKPRYTLLQGASNEEITIETVHNFEFFRNFYANTTIILPTENVQNGTIIMYFYDRNDFSSSTLNLGERVVSVPTMGGVTLVFANTSWNIISANDKYTLDKVYPIGSIYQNARSSDNPRTLFGIGAWHQITDKFLASYGSKIIEQQGGNDTVTLQINNLPTHHHDMVHTHNWTGERVNVSKAFWAMVHSGVGVETGSSGQPTYVDNISPFKNANMQNLAGDVVNTEPHTGGSAVNTGSIGFDYTPSGNISHAKSDNNTDIVNTGDTGEGESFSIIPPYYAVYTWRRSS